MSCSVYDPRYIKLTIKYFFDILVLLIVHDYYFCLSCNMRALQVIAICESKEEDCESQVLFWETLNRVVEQCGQAPPDFAGFMSDEARANWLAIRTVYNGGPQNVMEGRERSCLFHWKQSLHKYTKKLISSNKQQEHISMCEAWRNAMTVHEANDCAKRIKEWWNDNVSIDNIIFLQRWFNGGKNAYHTEEGSHLW